MLNYGIEIYGNVWGIFTLDQQHRKGVAFTKEDNRRLQILVNKVLRCLTDSDRDTPTVVLHSKSNQLSVQQRCAFFSLMSMHKTMKRKEPIYHHNRFISSQRQHNVGTRSNGTLSVDYRLSLSRNSYFYRSSRLYNSLPMDLLNIDSVVIFKKKVKEWLQRHVAVVPL